jgi:glycosyltransferase involved in cell wall biosynthesis
MSNDSKIKILVVAANNGGCAYYRALMPFGKLQQKFEDEVEVRFDLNPLRWDEEKKEPVEGVEVSEDFEWADVVFSQNISNLGPRYMVSLVDAVKENGCLFHYDTDDLLTDLYTGHRLYKVYTDGKLGDLTKMIYSQADIVSVTQRKFAERIAPYVKGTLVVIKNAIDFDLPCWNFPRRKVKNLTRIGWVGGIHHEQDVKQVPSIALGVNAKVGPEKVAWGFFGRPPLAPGDKGDWQQDVWDNYEKILTQGIKHRNYRVYPGMSSDTYGLMYTNIDVSIAPLEWNEFNDSKSEIKAMECGRYGIPLVATDCGCYDEIIENGVTGYLIDKNNPRSEWVRILSKCIKDKKHVEEMGRNLKELTDERFDINKHVGDRLELYKGLISGKN